MPAIKMHVFSRPRFSPNTFTSQQKQRKYHKIKKLSQDPRLIFCSTPDCPGDLTVNPKLSNCFGIVNCFKGILQCNACSLTYCANCSLPSHTRACIITDKSKDEDMVDTLEWHYLFRRCGRCSMVVEKRQGCDHITCKCKFQFCYTCGRDYGVHFCTFTQGSLDPFGTRVLRTCIYILLMIILLPLDIVLSGLFCIAPVSGILLIVPAAVILGLQEMRNEECCAILVGNVFLFIQCFLSSIPNAIKWYCKDGVQNWIEALRYRHFSYFFMKITKMLVYRLPVPCNHRKIVPTV